MDINSCHLGEKEWQCPEKDCQKVLSRKQTLLVHIRTFHQELYSQLDIDKPKPYKRYELDSSIPIPKSTRHWKKTRQCENSDQTNSNDPSSAASLQSTSSVPSHPADIDSESNSECQLDFTSLSLPTLESSPATNFHDDDDMSISASDDCRSNVSGTNSSGDEGQDLPSQHLTTETLKEIADPPMYVIPTQIYSSSITRSEHILAVSSLASRFNLSSKAIEAVLELTQIHLPDVNIGETSVEHLKDERGFGKDYITYQLYCESCKKLFSNEVDYSRLDMAFTG